jgi:hypothetical protein
MTKRTPPGWQPGQSGNPKGRPPGTGDVALIRTAIAQRMPELIDILVSRALSGDVAAARLLLERTVAPLKASEAPQAIRLPNASLSDQGRAVVACVAAGELPVGQGAALLSAIGSLARVVEVDELVRRIEALESGVEAHRA